jgi:hypothetical protein
MSGLIAKAKELDAQPTRRFDIDPERIFGYQHSVMELHFTLPDGWKAQLPANVKATGPFGSYESTYTQNGRELSIARTMTGATGIVSKSRVKELSAWMREIGKDDATLIILQKE